MEKMDYKFINAMTKQGKISLISENKSSKWTSEAKKEHVEKLANSMFLSSKKQDTNNR